MVDFLLHTDPLEIVSMIKQNYYLGFSRPGTGEHHGLEVTSSSNLQRTCPGSACEYFYNSTRVRVLEFKSFKVWCAKQTLPFIQLVIILQQLSVHHTSSMSRYMQYYISLNKSTLVFFPPRSKENSSNVYVVQVMIKSKQ